MTASRKIILPVLIAALAAGICRAQFWGGRRQVENVGPIVYTEGGDAVDERTVRTAREIASHSTGTANWTNAPGFEKDVFTFTRIMYQYGVSGEDPRISYTSSPWGWITDYPDSDLNFSFRLQQMTSLKVDPNGREVKLTDPALFDYPWIYIVEAGRMELRDEEIPILRKYLLNGGVLMADDFWGWKQWDNFEYWMKKVLPERNWTELPMDHPLFHCVFDIKVPKNKLQTPNSHLGAESLNPNSPRYGVTWEFHDGEQCREMHVRAWLDDKGRIMAIATHNCDMGDSWEREGEEAGFFHEFSEKRGYPLGINIVFYIMTH
jgi:hypothetical protein